MALKLITAPAEEPVTLAEAKAQLRVDISDDDTLISGLITAARVYAETVSGEALITQTWELVRDTFPAASAIVLPRPPLVSITSIKYTDEDGVEATFASSNYLVDTDSKPGKVVLKSASSWPSFNEQEVNAVRIRFVCGYGDPADVPENYKLAIKMMVGHWYENREAIVITGAVPKEVPLAVNDLLVMDRYQTF